MEFLKHTTTKPAGPVTTMGAGTANGHGMDCGKDSNASQMNASSMITKAFIQQVPAGGTPAGKSGTGKEINKMATTEVSAYGMNAGK